MPEVHGTARVEVGQFPQNRIPRPMSGMAHVLVDVKLFSWGRHFCTGIVCCGLRRMLRHFIHPLLSSFLSPLFSGFPLFLSAARPAAHHGHHAFIGFEPGLRTDHGPLEILRDPGADLVQHDLDQMVILDIRIAIQGQVVVLGRLLLVAMVLFDHRFALQNHLPQPLDLATRARALPLRLLELVPLRLELVDGLRLLVLGHFLFALRVLN
mmetsp:Transcript_2529/g.7270  ORF Transcript_2529/g.7270 Transcript_2529/m.7270 type:complete len:210 (-) Transcript_2529:4776-5405(-)